MPVAVNVSEFPATRIQREASIAGKLLWPLVALIGAPLAIFPSRFPVAAIAIGLALMMVPFVVRWAETGVPFVMRPATWLSLFILTVSLPVASWISPYFLELTWPELIRAIWGLYILFAVANWCVDAMPNVSKSSRVFVSPALASATAAYLLVGALFGLVGLLALQPSNKVPLLTTAAERIQSIVGDTLVLSDGFNANRVAGLVVLFVPLCACLCLSPGASAASTGARSIHWLGRLAIFVSFIFFAAILLLTQSRTALLAATLATPLALLLAGWRGWIGLAIGAVLASAIFSVYGPRTIIEDLLVTENSSQFASLSQSIMADRNIEGRLVIWRRAIAGLHDQPLTGMGLAVFQRRALEHYPSAGWQPDPDITHAHNLVLQTGLDLGLPGLLAFMLLLGALLRDLDLVWRRSLPNSPVRIWCAGLCGSFAAFLVYNIADAMTLGARPAFSYWFLFGLIIGAAAIIRREPANR